MKMITISNPFRPEEQRDLAPLKVGTALVLRRALPGTPRTVYLVMNGMDIAGRQLSYPTPTDCAAHLRDFDRVRGTRRRVPNVVATSMGTLAERVVVVLKLSECRMSISDLTATMKCSTDSLSPVMNRLVRNMRVRRSGQAGAFLFSSR
jgi:hypothetical protein